MSSPSKKKTTTTTNAKNNKKLKSKEKAKTKVAEPEIELPEYCIQILFTKTPVQSVLYINGSIFSCGWDNFIRHYDLKTSKLVKRISGHTNYVHALTLLNTSLFTASLDKTIRHFDIRSGTQKQEYRGHTGAVLCLVLSEATNTLYSGSGDCTIKSWDMRTTENIKTFTGHQSHVSCLQLQGNKLYSGSWDCTIKVWDISTTNCLMTLAGTRGWILSLVVQGDKLFSGSQENIIRVWDILNGECIYALEGHTDAVQCIILSTEIEGTGNKKKKKAPPKSSQTALPPSSTLQAPPTTSTLSPEKSTQPFKPTEKRITEQLTTGSPSALPIISTSYSTPVVPGLRDIGFSLGRGELITGSKDCSIIVWDLNSGEKKWTFKGHASAVHSLQVAEKLLYSGSIDGTVRAWDLKEYLLAKKKAQQIITEAPAESSPAIPRTISSPSAITRSSSSSLSSPIPFVPPLL